MVGIEKDSHVATVSFQYRTDVFTDSASGAQRSIKCPGLNPDVAALLLFLKQILCSSLM
jgi:hypothetical protein